MNNDELYHYGVPGMRWGHKKAQPIQGQNMRGSAKQPTTNIKRTSKPKTSNSSNKKAKPTDEEKAQLKEEQAQAKAERKAQSFKRGLIAVGIALAVIGGVILAKKIANNITDDKKGAYNHIKNDVSKKIDKGKKTVEKAKSKVVKKSIFVNPFNQPNYNPYRQSNKTQAVKRTSKESKKAINNLIKKIVSQ